jgi:zinc transport system substrate-binding protein
MGSDCLIQQFATGIRQETGDVFMDNRIISRLNPTMGRRTLLGLLAISAGTALVGCSNAGKGASAQEGDKGTDALSICASFYPMYDFAGKLAGDRATVTCLVPAGTEPHDWEPSTTDVRTISTCDMLVYNGAGMEHWIGDVSNGISGEKPVLVCASDGLELRELPEGEGDEDETGTDPHVWLSPVNAKHQLGVICDAIVSLDPAGREEYDANYERWAAEFEKLDSEFSDDFSNLSNRTLVVSHEAFGYLCDAYGLTQVAIAGIDAEGEPNAQQMAEIAQFVRENNVKTIFTEELVSPKVAEAIASETGATVEELNPLEGLSDEELANGEDYFSVMRKNLAALREALA